MLALPVQAQYKTVTDPTESSYKLVYRIPLDVFSKLQRDYHGVLWYYNRYFIDSRGGHLGVGLMLDKPPSSSESTSMKKFIVIDSAGKVCKQWPWVDVGKMKSVYDGPGMVFRSLDSHVYYAGDKMKGLLLGDTLSVVDNPWFRKNLIKSFPSIATSYVQLSLNDMRVPMIRFTKEYIYSIDSEAVLRVYDRNPLRQVNEVRLKFPTGESFFGFLSGATQDPLLGIFRNYVLFDAGYYDIDKQQFFWTDSPSGKYFDGIFIGTVKGESDMVGSGYFVRSNKVYKFFFTNEGLFIFCLKI